MSWDLLEAAAGATIDAVLEEDFTIQRAAPSQDVNARRTPAGQPVPFLGIWIERHVQRFPDARGHASSDAREFGAGKVKVDFPTAALPFRAKEGDRVTRVKTGAVYAVADIGDNGFTRTALALTGQV